MKTLADLKRRIAAPGTVLVLTEFLVRGEASNHTYLNMPRTIKKVQTNALMFDGGSWLNFPKAAELEIVGPDEFNINSEAVTLRYKFVQPTLT